MSYRDAAHWGLRPLPAGNRVAIVSNAGGALAAASGVLTAGAGHPRQMTAAVTGDRRPAPLSGTITFRAGHAARLRTGSWPNGRESPTFDAGPRQRIEIEGAGYGRLGDIGES